MDEDTQILLENIAHSVDESGLEDIILLSSEEHVELEKGLTDAILHAGTGIVFQELIQLRYLFRVLKKFGTDIHRGLNRLNKYCNDE